MLSVAPRDGTDVRRKSCPATVKELDDRPDPLYTPIRSCSITDTQAIDIKGKQQAHQKLRRFEDELRRTFSKVRSVAHLRAIAKMSQSRESISSGGGGPSSVPSTPPAGDSPNTAIIPATERSLHVVHSNALLTLNHKKKTQNAAVEFLLRSEDDAYENNDKNANPTLSLGSLRNGRFSAGITLNKFPAGGELIIRVTGYKLDFFWLAERPKTGRRNSSVYTTKPLHCNNVDLPMYVDPQNLDFTLDNETKIIVSGKTKGFLCRRKSISTDDLSVGSRQFMKAPKENKRGKTMKKKTPVELAAEREARERSYTR